MGSYREKRRGPVASFSLSVARHGDVSQTTGRRPPSLAASSAASVADAALSAAPTKPLDPNIMPQHSDLTP